jgi:hypothetical protein
MGNMVVAHAAPGQAATAPADGILAANRAAVGDPPPRSTLPQVPCKT